MAVFESNLSRDPQEWQPKGDTPFHFTVTVPTEALDSADEQVLLYQFATNPFGNECWLENCILSVEDLDGGAGLVFDVGLGDEDGVIDTVLVTGSTAGQAGGTEVVIDYADLPVDVSGLFLILDVTTAAVTPTAGDVEVFGGFAGGVQSKTAIAEEV